MKLNCRPGDLAVVIHGKNIGLFVNVIESSVFFGPTYWLVESIGRAGTSVNPQGHRVVQHKSNIEDCRLRPLRDNPGQDETLTWIDVPTGVTA